MDFETNCTFVTVTLPPFFFFTFQINPDRNKNLTKQLIFVYHHLCEKKKRTKLAVVLLDTKEIEDVKKMFFPLTTLQIPKSTTIFCATNVFFLNQTSGVLN